MEKKQCNITDASPHLTTGLLLLDLYSDLGSGLCSQRNLLKILYLILGEWNFVTFLQKVKICCRTIIDLMFERHKQARG